MLDDYKIYNISDLLKIYGLEFVKNLIKTFKCDKNKEIESFLFNNACDFALKKISITYFICNKDDEIVGYFTLTHKPLYINVSVLSKTTIKKLSNHAKFDEKYNAYAISAFLIAQLGKNSNIAKSKSISGKNLMLFALEVLLQVQKLIGGGIVFLECENNSKLLKFYQDNNFKIYGKRLSHLDNIEYIQLLRII